MKKSPLPLLLACSALAFAGNAAADLHVEPDDFRLDTVLTHAVSGVTLSLSFADGALRQGFSIVAMGALGGRPSTGDHVFGVASRFGGAPGFYFGDSNLRADFDSTVNRVSIDFIGTAAPPEFQTRGLLRAFSSNGDLLASTLTVGLSAGVFTRATVVSTDVPIAYVLASPAEGSGATYLDNFVASTVPTPPAAWLFAGGLLGLGAVARRSRPPRL